MGSDSLFMEQKIYTEEECEKNMGKCKSFERCNTNICPLDFNIDLRAKYPEGKICRWMRNETEKEIAFRGQNHPTILRFGGRTMPDDLLKFVPESNLKWLNEASRKRWHAINKN